MRYKCSHNVHLKLWQTIPPPPSYIRPCFKVTAAAVAHDYFPLQTSTEMLQHFLASLPASYPARTQKRFGLLPMCPSLFPHLLFEDIWTSHYGRSGHTSTWSTWKLSKTFCSAVQTSLRQQIEMFVSGTHCNNLKVAAILWMGQSSSQGTKPLLFACLNEVCIVLQKVPEGCRKLLQCCGDHVRQQKRVVYPLAAWCNSKKVAKPECNLATGNMVVLPKLPHNMRPREKATHSASLMLSAQLFGNRMVSALSLGCMA